MTSFVLRRLLTVSCLSASFLAAPSDSHAACALFEKMFGSGTPTTANYCTQPVVANYVPQTAYRTELVNVPVTTYRPVCSCDPCTGCPTTVMMPATAMMQQTRMVPYTTYRLQYAAQRPACSSCLQAAPVTAAYAPSCSTCGSAPAVTTMMAPATTMMMAPARPACSSCGGGANVAPVISSAPAMMSAPAPMMTGNSMTFAPSDSNTSGYRPSDISPSYESYPATTTYVPGPVTAPDATSSLNPTPAPLYNATQQPGTEKTFETPAQTDTTPKPIPHTDSTTPMGTGTSTSGTPMSLPRIVDPENKTTMLRRPWAPTSSTVVAARPATAKLTTIEPAATTQPVATGTQWRASNR